MFVWPPGWRDGGLTLGCEKPMSCVIFGVAPKIAAIAVLGLRRGPVVSCLRSNSGAVALTDGQGRFSAFLLLTSLYDPPLLCPLPGEHLGVCSFLD